MNAATVADDGIHLTKEAVKDHISIDDVNAVLEEGEAFYDRARDQIALVSNLPRAGQKDLVVVIVDPFNKVKVGDKELFKGVTAYREHRKLNVIEITNEIDPTRVGEKRFISLERIPQ